VARTYRLGPARTAVNTVMTALLRVGLGPASTYLLTTVGARSSRPRTTPVTLVESGAGRWLVSPYGDVGWVHNVRADPLVRLRRGHRSDTLQAREVTPESAGPVLRQYRRQVRVSAPFFDAAADDPTETFVTEAARHPVFALTPVPMISGRAAATGPPRPPVQRSRPRVQADLDGQLHAAAESLHRQFDDELGAAAVGAEIQQVTDRFADARIRTYVALFVHRFAGAELRAVAAGGIPGGGRPAPAQTTTPVRPT
jgi:deazaflavin-dependent oxidoreductase (nitroreductase family)